MGGKKEIYLVLSWSLSNDDGYVTLKRAAEDREGWRHRERMSKTCSTAEATDDALPQ